MKTYRQSIPNIYGVLSDDHLYFEGVNRPQIFYTIRDELPSSDNIVILDKYLNDLYNLFLRKLSTYISLTEGPVEESLKLQALLQEIIKVKDLIEKATSIDIMDK